MAPTCVVELRLRDWDTISPEIVLSCFAFSFSEAQTRSRSSSGWGLHGSCVLVLDDKSDVLVPILRGNRVEWQSILSKIAGRYS